MKKKVLIAMSGGVDSSAAALLLQKQGYECAGATLSLCFCSKSAAAEESTPPLMAIKTFFFICVP